MNIRNLTYLIVALLATGLLWGCGSSGGGGSDFGQRDIAPEYLGNTNCLTCHDGVHTNDTNNLTEGKLSHLAGIIDTDAPIINNSWYIAHACEDCHGGGSAHRGIGPIPFPQPDLARCATCHNDAATKLVDARHNRSGNAFLEAQSYTSANCRACHTVEGFIDVSAGIDFVHAGTDHTITCAACHDSLTMELRTVGLGEELSCSQCHTGIGPGSIVPGSIDVVLNPDGTPVRNHLRNKPFSDEIYQRFMDGRHTDGRARDNNCAACHSHEGALVMFSQGEKFNTIAQIESISADLAALGGTADLNKKTCATCHDPHSGELRGSGNITQVIGASSTATGPAERVVFSTQYNLCTSCHQVNLDYEFNKSIGYSEGGMFEYSLSDAYLHANDPYGDPSNIGYHSNSYQDRSFFDTHFNGLISKDLYYYDISDKAANGYTGVDKARRDRNGVLIVTDNMDAAIAMLEAYYQEYLNAPENIEVAGYGVNPGSPYACSSCHDVHSANKIEGTAALIKADATGDAVGHVLMSEPSMQQAVAYGEGVGMTHNNYISDAFSLERIGCTPCHTGREFVSLTVGGEPESARWNSVGCISCHDMVDTAGVVLTEARTFPDTYTFTFNSGEVLPSDSPHLTNFIAGFTPAGNEKNNQVCFECHKGRDGYSVRNWQETRRVYDVNYLHYSPSFATLMGTESGMIPTYESKDYTGGFTIPDRHNKAGSGTGTSSQYVSCLACHNIHTPYGDEANHANFETLNLETSLCGSCHYVTDFNTANYWRSFNVLRERTKVFGDVLFETILEEVQASGGPWASETAATLKARINDRAAGSEMPSAGLAKAAAIWKNFMYDDKAGWAHNSILARQLMYDAIVNISSLENLNTKICAQLVEPEINTIGVRLSTAIGGIDRNLDAGTTTRPITCL